MNTQYSIFELKLKEEMLAKKFDPHVERQDPHLVRQCPTQKNFSQVTLILEPQDGAFSWLILPLIHKTAF